MKNILNARLRRIRRIDNINVCDGETGVMGKRVVPLRNFQLLQQLRYNQTKNTWFYC